MFDLYNIGVGMWTFFYTISGCFHLIHYTLIICHNSLDSTLHWLLCNISMNQIMHAVSALCFAKIFYDFKENALVDAGRSEVTDDLHIIGLGNRSIFNKVVLRSAMDTETLDSLIIILLASILTSFLFAVLALLQRYYTIDRRHWRRSGEVFNQRHAVLTVSLWVTSGFFGVTFVILRHENSLPGLAQFWRIYWLAQLVLCGIIALFLCVIRSRLVSIRRRTCSEYAPRPYWPPSVNDLQEFPENHSNGYQNQNDSKFQQEQVEQHQLLVRFTKDPQSINQQDKWPFHDQYGRPDPRLCPAHRQMSCNFDNQPGSNSISSPLMPNTASHGAVNGQARRSISQNVTFAPSPTTHANGHISPAVETQLLMVNGKTNEEPDPNSGTYRICPTWQTDFAVAAFPGIGALLALPVFAYNFIRVSASVSDDAVTSSHAYHSDVSLLCFAVINAYMTMAVGATIVFLLSEDVGFQLEWAQLKRFLRHPQRGRQLQPMEL